MNGRDTHGLMASALSVATIDYDDALDGISLTASTVPAALGRTRPDRIRNLVGVLDGFVDARGFHLNVNVLDREPLLDAMDHPQKYPNLTIRVSGYAVNFVRLTREQHRVRAFLGCSRSGWTALEPGLRSSPPVARCAACTARTPTPGSPAAVGTRRWGR
jgi:hypothetical protein